MKYSIPAAAIIVTLSLALELFFWYEQPGLPLPSAREVDFLVVTIGALVFSLKWTWNRLRAVAGSH